MPKFEVLKSDFVMSKVAGSNRRLLKKEVFARFDDKSLGLGDLKTPSTTTDGLACVFDLEGFTTFCKQSDAHLTVPGFQSAFLRWLMDELKMKLKSSEHADGFELWAPLPFYLKFTGDGILAIWNTETMDSIAQRNVVVSAMEICNEYGHVFVAKWQKRFADMPVKLRAGLALGKILSVGDGSDYIGSCINIASRVQAIPGFRFAFNTRGFDLEDPQRVGFFKKDIVVVDVEIRGIGLHERVGLLKEEYDALKQSEKEKMKLLGNA